MAKKKEVSKPISYVHVDTFLESAKFVYPELNSMTIAGFKALMADEPYQNSMLVFKKYLEEYLGVHR